MHIDMPSAIREILAQLGRCGHEAFAVGGCVRDALLGREPHDWDICTDAPPEEIKRCFARRHTIDTGIRHGTVTLVWDDAPYEITTYRVDGAYEDNRHPSDVQFVRSIELDLGRRDFTINAMAYNDAQGLIDPYGGQKDLADRVVRCVGAPMQRFMEDGLRILRGIRFATTLAFSVEAETARAIHESKALLHNISAERIAVELNGIVCGIRPSEMLLTFSDVFCTIIPELEPCIGFLQRNPHHHLPVWEHICLCVDNISGSNDAVLGLAALFHDIGKPARFVCGDDGIGHFYGHAEVSAQMADGILRRLQYDNETRERVVTLVRHHDAPIAPTGKSVRRWLNRLGPDALRQLLMLQRADALAQARPTDKPANIAAVEKVMEAVLAGKECFTMRDLRITGRDVCDLGVSQGPEVGAVLQTLLDEVIDGELGNEADALRARARALIADAAAQDREAPR